MPWGFFRPCTPVTARKQCSAGSTRRSFFIGEKEMPRRSDKRDAAREAYLNYRRDGEEVNLRGLADELGVKYNTLRRWKLDDKWDDLPFPPKKARGGQPNNRNAKGNPGGGAPPRNNNARKHGGYAAVFFDQLTDGELLIMQKTPRTAVKALHEELGLLKVQEKRILDQITTLEAADPDELYISTLMDMRAPGMMDGRKQDGARQNIGMYSKESAFTRKMHLQEALNKVQGRIATVIGKIQQAEETRTRVELERERLELMRLRATGVVNVPDDEEGDADDDPLHK
nr:MAG: hypothetical protein [Bacteriophage sp.]